MMSTWAESGSFITREQVEVKRAEIVANYDEAALRERAATYCLTAKELAVLDEIDALDFLLHG